MLMLHMVKVSKQVNVCKNTPETQKSDLQPAYFYFPIKLSSDCSHIVLK